jgi:DNA-directed RNA polymerase subunit RPC12/RpoP
MSDTRTVYHCSECGRYYADPKGLRSTTAAGQFDDVEPIKCWDCKYGEKEFTDE